jgi:adenylate cyclase class 2
MIVETEVKIRWPGAAAEAHTFLEAKGFAIDEPRALELNQIFDRASGELRQGGLVLRLRRFAGRSIVTYKGMASRDVFKSREEIEFEVSDPEAFETVLNRLGYHPGFRYEKYRTHFIDPQAAGSVVLDETPVGIYLELEGAEDWIDRTARRLGFTRQDYLTASYASLYQIHREQHPQAPSDMTFDLVPGLSAADKTTLERHKTIDSSEAR